MTEKQPTPVAEDLPPIPKAKLPLATAGLANAARVLARRDGITVAAAVGTLRYVTEADVAALAAEYNATPGTE